MTGAPRSRVLPVILALGSALVVLHWSGRGSLALPPLGRPSAWAAWVGGREPEEAAFALARMVGIGLGWYALVALVVGYGLRQVRATELVSIADRLTPPVLRRVLAATAAVSLLTTGLAGAAPTSTSTTSTSTTSITTPGSTTTVIPDAGSSAPVMRLLPPDGEEPASAPSTPKPSEPVLPATAEPPVAREAREAREWTVAPGQCFWSIADAALTSAWGRPPTDAEIVPYWSRLVETNRSRLHDPANPDLVYPGQVFTLPSPG